MSACVLAAACSLTFAGGAATGAATETGSCTWGASSMTATYVDGQLLQSQPETTGCAPVARRP